MTCLVSTPSFPHFLSSSQGFSEGISFNKFPEGWENSLAIKARLTTKMSINHLNRSSWLRLSFFGILPNSVEGLHNTQQGVSQASSLHLLTTSSFYICT